MMDKNELIEFILLHNKLFTKVELEIFSVEALLKLKEQLDKGLKKASTEEN